MVGGQWVCAKTAGGGCTPRVEVSGPHALPISLAHIVKYESSEVDTLIYISLEGSQIRSELAPRTRALLYTRVTITTAFSLVVGASISNAWHRLPGPFLV